MPEYFCTMYEKCEFLSMCYTSAKDTKNISYTVRYGLGRHYEYCSICIRNYWFFRKPFSSYQVVIKQTLKKCYWIISAFDIPHNIILLCGMLFISLLICKGIVLSLSRYCRVDRERKSSFVKVLDLVKRTWHLCLSPNIYFYFVHFRFISVGWALGTIVLYFPSA